MTVVPLPALVGTNPLAFLAALGVLDVLSRTQPESEPKLWWTDDLVPHAVIGGPTALEEVIDLVIKDGHDWLKSPVLSWKDDGKPPSDLKPQPAQLRVWAEAVRGDHGCTGRGDADLFCALMAEGAVAEKGDTKPTHLHFTAGQQRFLVMVRTLAEALTAEHVEEALRGPWRYDSELPSLGWDARGERIYALRGGNPAKEKRCGVPGADWLAFLGLTFFPVAARGAKLRTAGCSPNWKGGRFWWPLWTVPISQATARSLLTDPALEPPKRKELALRGISRVLTSPIRRSDPGGYGSFGPAELLCEAIRE